LVLMQMLNYYASSFLFVGTLSWQRNGHQSYVSKKTPNHVLGGESFSEVGEDV
jgi:hypothetical protein